MFCPKCGKENLDQNKFCNGCGETLQMSYTPPIQQFVPPPPIENLRTQIQPTEIFKREQQTSIKLWILISGLIIVVAMFGLIGTVYWLLSGKSETNQLQNANNSKIETKEQKPKVVTMPQRDPPSSSTTLTTAPETNPPSQLPGNGDLMPVAPETETLVRQSSQTALKQDKLRNTSVQKPTSPVPTRPTSPTPVKAATKKPTAECLLTGENC